MEKNTHGNISEDFQKDEIANTLPKVRSSSVPMNNLPPLLQVHQGNLRCGILGRNEKFREIFSPEKKDDPSVSVLTR